MIEYTAYLIVETETDFGLRHESAYMYQIKGLLVYLSEKP